MSDRSRTAQIDAMGLGGDDSDSDHDAPPPRPSPPPAALRAEASARLSTNSVRDFQGSQRRARKNAPLRRSVELSDDDDETARDVSDDLDFSSTGDGDDPGAGTSSAWRGAPAVPSAKTPPAAPPRSPRADAGDGDKPKSRFSLGGLLRRKAKPESTAAPAPPRAAAAPTRGAAAPTTRPGPRTITVAART
ncbi:hypothetical protein M885DRAFT_521291 [Pelagophyceae sp. CCMP2097]|nr:hypothetical protein M885DRAFT_521291 [Pelagophyceae sp. CCMP2097]